MAITNREYLENALNEQKGFLQGAISTLNSYGLNYNSLNVQLGQEIAYYSSLSAINIKKKKESINKQNALKVEILKIKGYMDHYKNVIIPEIEAKILDIEAKITAYDEAVNIGLESGLNEEESAEFGDVEIQSLVDEIKMSQTALDETESNKKMIRNLIIGIVIAVILAIIIALIIRQTRKNKAKKD